MNDVGEAEVPGGGAGGGGDHSEGILEEEVDPTGAPAHQGTGTVEQGNLVLICRWETEETENKVD